MTTALMLTAGPELDAMIERVVFAGVVGYPTRQADEHVEYAEHPPHEGIRPHRQSSAGWGIVPYYSVELSAASRVMVALDALGWMIAIEVEYGAARCRVGRSRFEAAVEVRVPTIDRLPEAICRAALQAVGGDREG